MVVGAQITDHQCFARTLTQTVPIQFIRLLMHLQDRCIEEYETANVLREVEINIMIFSSGVECFGIDVLYVPTLSCIQGACVFRQIARKGARPEAGLRQPLYKLVTRGFLNLAGYVDQLAKPLQVKEPAHQIDHDYDHHGHCHPKQDKRMIIVIDPRLPQDDPQQGIDIRPDKYGQSVLGIAVLHDEPVTPRRPLRRRRLVYRNHHRDREDCHRQHGTCDDIE